MALSFEEKQIVSSTEMARKFAKYLDKEVKQKDLFVFKHSKPEAVFISFDRFNKLYKESEEMKDILEHLAISTIMQKRKNSKPKKINMKKLGSKYGL